MNDIDILEEFIENYKKVQEKYKDDEIQAEIERSCYFEEVPYQAISNIIAENKELKEENEKLTSARNWYFEHFTAQACTPEMLDKILRFDYIPKSKVEEILDKAECMDYYCLPDVIEDLERLLGKE